MTERSTINPQFSFEGLKAWGERLKSLKAKVAYIVVKDRTDSGPAVPTGRFDLRDPTEVSFYDGGGLSIIEGDEDEEEADEFDPLGDDEGEEGEAEAEVQGQDEASGSLSAALHWLEDVTIRNTIGDSLRRFRVIAYREGGKYLESSTIKCLNHGFAAGPDLLQEEASSGQRNAIPEADLSGAVSHPFYRQAHILGELYTRFGEVVLGAMTRQEGLSSRTQRQLARHLHDSRYQQRLLLSEVLTNRSAKEELEVLESDAKSKSDTTRALGEQFMGKVGDAMQLYMMSQHGLPPAAQELLPLIQAHPELIDFAKKAQANPTLLKALGNPAIQEFLVDETTVAFIVQMAESMAGQGQGEGTGDPGEGDAAEAAPVEAPADEPPWEPVIPEAQAPEPMAPATAAPMRRMRDRILGGLSGPPQAPPGPGPHPASPQGR